MNIEIQQPKLEVLIRQRMASGRFRTVEDALVYALESSAASVKPAWSGRTGDDLIAAMQAMPCADQIEFDQARP